jgi:1,2-diacylglycerol 3-alpha-glucosyltransferase
MVKRADLPDIFHDATIFLSASTTEVHPISVIEAIASGLPIVAVQDEAFEGMVIDDENGQMTPLNIKAFSKALGTLLSDPAKLEKYGKRSSELSQKYSIEALEILYLEAILQNWRGKGVVRFLRGK